MPKFDDTDLEILRMLLADGRRPYSDIADAVGLSPPTVSDRVDRLQESGIINRFTVDLDRSKLASGVPVFVECQVDPGRVDIVTAGLREQDAVEYVFTTADARVFVKVFADAEEVRDVLSSAVGLDAIRDYDVHMLTDDAWTPSIGTAAFDLECAECGNSVTDEGTSVEIDDTLYHFCCSSCESQFVERYESLEEQAEAS